MVSITLCLLAAAAIITIWNLSTGKPVLGAAVLCLVVIEALRQLPK